MERKDNFYFLSFAAFPAYSRLKWTTTVFFNFLNFLAICLEFSITHRVGTERNGTIIFISHFLLYFQPILAWNEFIMIFFNFFIIFLEFSITRRIGTKRNYNFYFLSFLAFSSDFWLKMKPQWYFWIILLFFWEFFITCRIGT